jgi:protein-S-isoprenylcysteine O-methyltransferase Ste14
MQTTASTISEPSVPSAAPMSTRWAAVLDGLERLLVLAVYAYFVWRLVPAQWTATGPINLLLILSEGLVLVLFVIRRPARQITLRRSDWLLALGGSLLPLCVQPTAAPAALAPLMFCLTVMICGLLLQIHAKLSLGRSKGLVAANRGIKQAGPYQFVRHPMYAGYFLTEIGFLLVNPTVWNLAIYGLAATVQVLRLLAEERFLGQTSDYRQYMQAVRYRLLPGVF